MQSKVSSVPEDEEGDEASPITMTTQDPAHTPFTSVMIGSMTTSLWASASNVPLEPGTIDPLRVHQVIISSFPFHYVLIPIPLYPHSHSTMSSFPFYYILIPIPLCPHSHSIISSFPFYQVHDATNSSSSSIYAPPGFVPRATPTSQATPLVLYDHYSHSDTSLGSVDAPLEVLPDPSGNLLDTPLLARDPSNRDSMV